MAEEARVFFLRKRRERAEDTERRALLEGLGQTRSLIAQAYAALTPPRTRDSDRVLSSLRSMPSRPGTPTCCGGSRS